MIMGVKMISNVLCMMALLLANTAHAQKAGELLVFKDLKPGKWAHSGILLPNGSLMPGSVPEVDCMKQDEINSMRNDSLTLYTEEGGKPSKQCPTVVATNTPELAIVTMRCAEDKRMPGIKLGITNTIKRESSNTWTIVTADAEQKAASKVIMKYLGACTK